MEWFKRNTYLIHAIGLFFLLFVYGLLIGPLVMIGEPLYQFRDWVNIGFAIIVIAYLFFVRSLRKNVIDNFNWRSLFVMKNVLLSVGLLLLLFFTYKYIILIDPFANSYTKTVLKYGLTYDYSLVVMILMTTFGPLWEELFFREMLVGQLRKNIPLWLCIFISAVIFGLFHTLYPLFGATLGICFTIAYLYSKSWAVPTVMHIVWNLYIALSSL